jgi:hypothetical protein
MRRAALVLVLFTGFSHLGRAGEIEGDRQVAAGKMARLKVPGGVPKGGAVIWDVLPEVGDTEQLPDGRIVFTGPAGTYTVKARVVTLDGKGGVGIAEHRAVVVVGAGPNPLPPGPGPGPGPVPLPDGELGLRKASRDGAAGVPAPHAAQRAALAKAQRSHASAVAAGAFPGPAEYLAGWRAANTAAATPAGWKPWADAVSAKLADLYRSGKLPAAGAWAEAFNEIAAGLEDQ